MRITPPLKIQGIKLRIYDWIADTLTGVEYDRFVEPFAGSGSVTFNIRPNNALVCDNNPYIISFYKAIQEREITSEIAAEFIRNEGKLLTETDGKHYYTVRKRFNETHNPLDFLFLNRTCFNGLMRFNASGNFNSPPNKQRNKISETLIHTVSNNIKVIHDIVNGGNYTFKNQDFMNTLGECRDGDFLYCDPPYLNRFTTYYKDWSIENEKRLHDTLVNTGVPFMVSNWLKDGKGNVNESIGSIWKDCNLHTRDHRYMLGSRNEYRFNVTEVLLTNFEVEEKTDNCLF